jgi:hypothetical protein
MASFSIGGTFRECVEVDVLGYERSPVGNYHDDNWLRVRVAISVGAFSGAYEAAFLTDELASFKGQLETLYRTLEGTARFSTLEEQLSLLFSGNGRGEIIVQGEATDAVGSSNKLNFELVTDQTYLQATLQGLRSVADLFPVRAN